MKPRKVTWVLVSDASRARLYSATAGKRWKLVERFENPAGREHAHELVSDHCGSVALSGSATHRAGLSPHTDPHQNEAARFAHLLARRLSQGFGEASFDDVVLIAPPRFLGLLRGELDDNVKKRVHGTLAKDLSLYASHVVRARLLGAGIDA